MQKSSAQDLNGLSASDSIGDPPSLNAKQQAGQDDETYSPHGSLCSPTLETTSYPLLVFRTVSFIYLTYHYIAFFIHFHSLLNFVVYLTFYAYFLTWIYYFLVLQHFLLAKLVKLNLSSPSSHWYSWPVFIENLFQISFTFEVALTIIYWSAVYRDQFSSWFFYLTFVQHAVPLMLLFIDFLFNACQFRMKGFLWILLLQTIYFFCINLPYTLGAHPIYSLVKWKNGITYAVVFGSYVITFAAYGFGNVIYRCLKGKVISKKKE